MMQHVAFMRVNNKFFSLSKQKKNSKFPNSSLVTANFKKLIPKKGGSARNINKEKIGKSINTKGQQLSPENSKNIFED